MAGGRPGGDREGKSAPPAADGKRSAGPSVTVSGWGDRRADPRPPPTAAAGTPGAQTSQTETQGYSVPPKKGSAGESGAKGSGSKAGGNRLVIVESPAKAKTIAGYLGPGYTVESSIGHIRDLPTKAAEIPARYKGEPWARLGVDVDHDFEPI